MLWKGLVRSWKGWGHELRFDFKIGVGPDPSHPFHEVSGAEVSRDVVAGDANRLMNLPLKWTSCLLVSCHLLLGRRSWKAKGLDRASWEDCVNNTDSHRTLNLFTGFVSALACLSYSTSPQSPVASSSPKGSIKSSANQLRPVWQVHTRWNI